MNWAGRLNTIWSHDENCLGLGIETKKEADLIQQQFFTKLIV
jgi:hypothetical protein